MFQSNKLRRKKIEELFLNTTRFQTRVQKFEIENFWLTTELDLIGGWVDGWMDRWMDGWMGVKSDLSDCLQQSTKACKMNLL
jgi:hypothetical protein